MTSREIFNQVNPQALLQQQQAQMLQNAITGMSKQNIVSQAIMRNQQAQAQNQKPLEQMPQGTNPQGWGRTA